MTARSILSARLGNQKLARSGFHDPGDVVTWLGAVQAQDYAGAKWALGLRTNGVTDADVEQAFNAGTILRTHVLRPTWHFVAPADIRWMLALTAPRVHAVSAYYYRKAGLDSGIFARSRAALERALRGGTYLTRAELAAVLGRARIPADGLRLAYLMIRAELDGVICSGPRRGKQFTYALMDERAPHARTLAREEALAELTRRYISSHGPATLRDYAWWSGLTVRDAKIGLESVEPALAQEVMDGHTYWSVKTISRASSSRRASSTAHLLPNYDEYLITHKDRGLVVGAPQANSVVFDHHVVIDGQLAGTWRRSVNTGSVVVDVAPYRRLTRADTRALASAAERYGRFMNAAVVLRYRRASV